MTSRRIKCPRIATALFLCAQFSMCIIAGCDDHEMMDQSHVEPMEASKFFTDGQSARPLVPGTVARGMIVIRDPLAPQRPDEVEARVFPIPLTSTDLQRGQERFNIYCAACHGRLGDGNGMIVQRGFTRPPSYYEQRLRDAPVGHFYKVISDGYGAMYSQGDRISPGDRWRIAGYIRVLQASTSEIAPSSARASATQPAVRN